MIRGGGLLICLPKLLGDVYRGIEAMIEYGKKIRHLYSIELYRYTGIEAI